MILLSTEQAQSLYRRSSCNYVFIGFIIYLFSFSYPCICNTTDWDYEKNSIAPQEVTAHTDKKVWWICKQGHNYLKAISARTLGDGCPYCSNRKIYVKSHNAINSLALSHPDLISEWDFEKNDPLTPSDVVAGSGKKVWWKCKTCGNEWQTVIHNRVKGHGCPNVQPPICPNYSVKRNKV